MKTSLFAIMVALAAVQRPPQAPPTAPLDAAHCKCSIEVVVKRAVTGEPIPDVELAGLMLSNIKVSLIH